MTSARTSEGMNTCTRPSQIIERLRAGIGLFMASPPSLTVLIPIFQPHSYLRVAAEPHRGVDGLLESAVIVWRRVEYPFIASGRRPIGTTAAAV